MKDETDGLVKMKQVLRVGGEEFKEKKKQTEVHGDQAFINSLCV